MDMGLGAAAAAAAIWLQLFAAARIVYCCFLALFVARAASALFNDNFL